MLDTARVNATTLYGLAIGKESKKVDSFKAGWDLVMYLAIPAIQQRSREGLSSALIEKMDKFLGVAPVRQPVPRDILSPSKAMRPRKCEICIQNVRGEGYKKKKSDMKQIKTQCQKCESSCCNEHYVLLCRSCFDM